MKKHTANWRTTYFTILAGQATSLITSAILQMAIIFYITDRTGSALMLSLASLVGFLPYAVFGPFIGVLVDRYDRKLIMIAADLLIAAAAGAMAVAALYVELPIWLIMLVLFIRSLGTAFHAPALSAATPLLVPQQQLTKCAGYSQSLQSLSYIISPAIGALLYSAWRIEAIIALDIIGALIASATVASVSIPKPERLADQAAARGGILEEMRAGFAVLRENRGLFTLLLVGAAYMFIYMPINALFPLMSMGHFSGTPMHASIVEIAYASGMMGGGLLLGTWGGFSRRTYTISASILLMGVSLTVSGLLPASGFVLFVVCGVAMGLSVPFYSGVQTALFQEKVEPQYLGRVFALTGSVISLAMPLGLGLSGLFADRIGVPTWFLFSGALIVAIAILTAINPAIRSLDQAREGSAGQQ